MSRTRASVLPLAAAAVVGALLPISVSPAQAVQPSALDEVRLAKAEPGFVGYSTSSTGAPMRVEIYEPTIPLPSTPQGELSYGYTAIIADSTSARARSSYLWPGGPVGEGFKTIVENLGFPEEISGPLGENGYPIQVNAVFPGGPEKQNDEPFPGTMQRASADQDQAEAINGYSTDGKPDEEEDGADSGEGGGGGPGLPALPLPIAGGSGGLSGLLGSSASANRAAAADDAAPLLPPELAALVDIGGFTSVSTSDVDTIALSRSRSNVSDITLLGGAVTLKSVKTLSRTSSNGVKGIAEGETQYGDLVIFGQRFKYGADGYEATGQGGSIPGLPDDAAEALAQLGLTISMPKPTLSVEGDIAEATVPGMIIDFDLTVLRTQLAPLTGALNEILGQIPNETGQLKSLIQAAANLSPRMVFTLGFATSKVDTSQPLPPLDPTDPTEPE
ncbi:MAG: choice-of-anchor P family protein, partial [Nocardioides sp.]